MPRISLSELALRGADHRNWYHDANESIADFCTARGVPFFRFTNLLALFSPRVSVTRSVRFAWLYESTGEFAHDCIRSVRSSVLHYEATSIIRGPKTSAFAACLQCPDIDRAVIDVWMARALRIDQHTLGKPKSYRAAEFRIQCVARHLGWSVPSTQAAIWSATVRRYRPTVPQLDMASIIGEL